MKRWHRPRAATVWALCALMFAGALVPAVCVEAWEWAARLSRRARTEVNARRDEQRCELRRLMDLAGGGGR